MIYLAARYIGPLAGAVTYVVGLGKPILIGLILALCFNVPMRFCEQVLKAKCGMKKGVRPLAILLALVLVLGIFIGIAVLVVPELLNAVSLIVQIISGGLEQLAQKKESASSLPE